jgi:hypothetical protein
MTKGDQGRKVRKGGKKEMLKGNCMTRWKINRKERA